MGAIKLILGATVVACLFAGGCYLGPARGEVAMGIEQPAPPAEVIAPAPGLDVDFFWIPGWWAWEGGRWGWHGGYWAHRPHPGAVWVPHSWVRGPHGGWIHGGGHWR